MFQASAPNGIPAVMSTTGGDDRGTAQVVPRPQLITYPDSLGGDLDALSGVLEGPMAGLFRGVHILPPYPSSGDRGFSPLTHVEIDPKFGGWEDIEKIATHHDVMLDLMVNHMSRRSPEFRDFVKRGRESPYADLFLTLDKVWPDASPPFDDLGRIFLRKPGSPFTTVTISDTGEPVTLWTTFGTKGASEQIDLDVHSELTRAMIEDWLRVLASHGARMIRFDAVGYVIKKPGTSCFMIEPDIYEYLGWASATAARFGLTLLPEVHDRYQTHQKLSDHGYWTYDFVLPALVLNALLTGTTARLATHLSASPDHQFTTLDCHDGIPVRPDLDGILEPDEMRELAEGVVAGGGNVSRLVTSAPGEVDIHQLNGTYYSALGEDDDRYVAARAIQLFARGVPQIYYVGLLAGTNDHDAVERTGEGRAINRHDYTLAEIDTTLSRPVVGRLLELVRLRNTHPAFEGRLQVETESESRLRLDWIGNGVTCSLYVDLATGHLDVET
jgi:sucrose phosphorylase